MRTSAVVHWCKNVSHIELKNARYFNRREFSANKIVKKVMSVEKGVLLLNIECSYALGKEKEDEWKHYE